MTVRNETEEPSDESSSFDSSALALPRRTTRTPRHRTAPGEPHLVDRLLQRREPPHVSSVPRGTAVELDESTLVAVDDVVVVTHHAAFDWALVARAAPLVVDTQNAPAGRMAGDPRYFKA